MKENLSEMKDKGHVYIKDKKNYLFIFVNKHFIACLRSYIL